MHACRSTLEDPTLLPAWDVTAVEFPHALLPAPWIPLAVWGGGAAYGLARVLADAAHARAIVRRARPVVHASTRREVLRLLHASLPSELAARVRVRTTDALTSPAVTGWRRPTLLLPADVAGWSGGDLRAALRHECAHVARGDWSVGMLESIVAALCWINPVVRLAFRASAVQREMAADCASLGHRVDAASYAGALLRVARAGVGRERLAARAPLSVVGFSSTRALETRIHALFDPACDRRDRRQAVARRVLPLFAVLVPALASATLWTCLP